MQCTTCIRWFVRGFSPGGGVPKCPLDPDGLAACANSGPRGPHRGPLYSRVAWQLWVGFAVPQQGHEKKDSTTTKAVQGPSPLDDTKTGQLLVEACKTGLDCETIVETPNVVRTSRTSRPETSAPGSHLNEKRPLVTSCFQCSHSLRSAVARIADSLTTLVAPRSRMTVPFESTCIINLLIQLTVAKSLHGRAFQPIVSLCEHGPNLK